MKPNKALQELVRQNPEALTEYAALSRPVQRFLNALAKAEPQEREDFMHQLADKVQGREGLKAARA